MNIEDLTKLANGAPGAQAQPVDGDWLHRLGSFSKRLLVGGVDAAQGAANTFSMTAAPWLNPTADDDSDQRLVQNAEPVARQALGTPEPTNLEERIPEEIGGTLANIPFAGAGKVAQGANWVFGVGLPEALHGIKNLISPAEAATPDDGLTKDAPVEKPEGDHPAPYAPRLDGTQPVPDDHDGLTKPSDWLGSVENDGRYWAGAGAIAATALGAFAAMRYNASTAASLATRVGELTSTNTMPRVTGLWSALNGGTLDRQGPLKSFFKVMDPATSDLFADAADTKLTNAAVNQKIGSTMSTGEYAGTSVSGTAPVDFFTAVGKQTREPDVSINSLEQRLGWEKTTDGTKQFDNYLIAANELDIRRAADAKWTAQQFQSTGVMPPSRVGMPNEIRPNLWDKSTNELEQYVQQAGQNPVFAHLKEMHAGMMQDMGDYMLQKGLLSQQDLTDIRNLYPNYTPLTMRTNDPMMTRIKDMMLPKFERLKWDNQESLLNRSLEDRGGISGQPGDAQYSALSSTDQYMQSMMKYAETNDVRKWFLGKAMAWQQGQTGPKVFSTTSPDDPAAMMFRAAGKPYYIKITDPAIRGALEANPIMSGSLWNAARTTLQQTVTGILAPWFSVPNLIHMSMRGAAMREPGAAFGYGDKLMNMAGYKGPQVDPTAWITGGIDGVARNLYGTALSGLSSGLRQSIENDGVLSKLLGSNAQAVSDAASDAFLRTTLHSLREQGVGHSNALGVIGEGDDLSSLSKLAPAYSGNPLGLKSLYNLYDGVISAVRNGAEAHMYAMNTKAAATDADKMASAAMTRDLGGDPARHGSSKVVGGITSAFPYSNVTLQGWAKIARSFRDNPLSATTGLISTVGVPAAIVTSMLANLSPQERDEYFKLTPETRIGSIVMPIAGVASEMWSRIPVAPELRPMWALAMTMFDKIYGLSSNVIDHQDHQDIKKSLSTLVENMHADDMKTAALSGFFAGLPPPVNAVAGAAGINLDLGSAGPAASSISGQRLDNFDPNATKFPDDALYATHEKVITSILGQVGQIGVQMARAYHFGSQGQDSVWKGIKDAGSTGVDELARRVPEVSGMLWGVPQRLSPHNADGDLLTHKMDAMKALARTEAVQIEQGGATTPAGQGLVVNHGGMQNGDLGQILVAMKGFQKTIKPLLDQRANAYSQMSAINGASSINMPNKQTLSNGYTKTIEEVNRATLDAVHQFEDQMTATHPQLAQKMGGRITLENLVGQR